MFFRLPNGQGLLYSLRGISLNPKAEDVIFREVPCKTKYVELLKIKNWLHYSQRFSVRISCEVNDNEEDLVWTCTGVNNLDLPPLEEKEYNLNFFAYKPGRLTFHVRFYWFCFFFFLIAFVLNCPGLFFSPTIVFR